MYEYTILHTHMYTYIHIYIYTHTFIHIYIYYKPSQPPLDGLLLHSLGGPVVDGQGMPGQAMLLFQLGVEHVEPGWLAGWLVGPGGKSWIWLMIKCWLVVSTPLKNMKVNWDDDIPN